jgi:hypothetical protein
MLDRSSLLGKNFFSCEYSEFPALSWLLLRGVVLSLLAFAALKPLRAFQESPSQTNCLAEVSGGSGRSGGNEKASTDNSARPVPAGQRPIGTRFGVAFSASTLGLGADVVVRAASPVNVRVGFNIFRYDSEQNQDGVSYHGALHLKSMNVLTDWYPISGGFHLSTGLLFYNANRVTAKGSPPTGKILTAGQEVFISDPQNPIVGNASSKVQIVAPMLLVGYGNLLPRSHHFAYSVDLGVAYQGSPKSSFNLAGGACDPTGQFCGGVAADANIQAAVQSARHDLDDGVSFMRYYPVLSLAIGYHF